MDEEINKIKRRIMKTNMLCEVGLMLSEGCSHNSNPADEVRFSPANGQQLMLLRFHLVATCGNYNNMLNASKKLYSTLNIKTDICRHD